MLLDTVRKTVREHSLINKGDTVICAVSGGADSVCLLNVMLSLKEELNLHIAVANVNHMIRGEESDRDSDFVKALCRKHSVECFYREYDVVNIAKERKTGEEECGRILRYEFFEEISKKLGGAKIATAHNLGDNAETVLFRLVRGSSPHGLCGIKYKRGNIIRPLLDVSRSEIEKYLCERKLIWCEDSTNKLTVYTRNKIRLSVIPQLEEIVTGAEEKIVSAAKMIARDNEYLDTLANQILEQSFQGDYLCIEPVTGAPSCIRDRVVSTVLKSWGAEVSSDRVEAFSVFMSKDSGKRFDICKGKYAEKNYGNIYIRDNGEKNDFSAPLSIDCPVYDENWRIEAEISEKAVKRKNNNIAVFDACKIPFPVNVRYRKDGDRISLKGVNGTKKLSDVFSDEKIPRYMRDYIPVVEKDGEILYIGGLRQSCLYEIDEKTEKYLIIRYIDTKER